MKDRFGREINYLRLSVTERCSLRCRYCMPEEGIRKRGREELLTEEEMLLAAEAAASLGIRKLRITGGEPLVKKNILSLCARAARIPGIEELCLTTNGILLPELAKPLRDAGVRRVNISLDTLDPEKYVFITRRDCLSQALRGVESALSAGFDRVKLNTVLIGGFNDDEIEALARLTLEAPMDVRFIELMPMYGGGDFGPEAMIPCRTVLDRLPDLEIAEAEAGTAALYRLPGALGRVGLISPVTEPFCARCSRLRLTADGHLRPCLHDAREYPLKGLSLPEMQSQFRRAILEKPPCHGGLSPLRSGGGERTMNRIGG